MYRTSLVELLILIISLSLCLAACTGTEVGNPQDAEVSVEVQGIDRSTSGALTLASGVTIEEAWLVVDGISLRTGQDCDETISTDYDYINALELIEGVGYPGYDMTILPAQNYCRFIMDLHAPESDELPAQAPEELEGHSIFLRGTTPDEIPFEIRHRESESLEFHGRFTLYPSTQSLFAIFEVDRWLSPEQLQEATDDESEALIISEDSHSDLLEDFLEDLQDSGILVRDANDDGVLQDEELDFPLARGDARLIGDD